MLASYLSNKHQRVKIQSSRIGWGECCENRYYKAQYSIICSSMVFLKDMSHFIEKCALYYYGSDNFMSYAFLDFTDVLSYLKRDCDNAVKWFEINGMQADPCTFQLMVMSNGSVDKVCVSLCANESEWLVLHLMIDLPSTSTQVCTAGKPQYS